jgi:hypothetical protein
MQTEAARPGDKIVDTVRRSSYCTRQSCCKIQYVFGWFWSPHFISKLGPAARLLDVKLIKQFNMHINVGTVSDTKDSKIFVMKKSDLQIVNVVHIILFYEFYIQVG